MVIGELVRITAAHLTENPRFEAEQIVMKALNITRTHLITDSKKEVSESEITAVEGMVKRRLTGEPLQYILGECEFMSLPFRCESGVLIPRSDTETLALSVIERAKPSAQILDICCGTGCIGISLAHFINGASVTMLDVSEKALSLAEENARLNKVADRTEIKRMDILSEMPQKKYDIIVSNPPYIETAVIETLDKTVKDYEPRLALDGGEDGLVFYRRIASIAPALINEGGFLAFEIGFNQGTAIKTLMEKDFRDVQVIKDLAGNDRVVIGMRVN